MLKAGAASVDITPPVGIDLAGYAGRPGPASGVHDPLSAKALYLEADDQPFVFITADLIGVDHEAVGRIRQSVHEQVGIDPRAVMVCCSHTHSGPAMPCLSHLGEFEEDYVAVVEGKLAGVAAEAARRARPASLCFVRERGNVGVNRRQRTENGIVLGVNPAGLVLPWVDVISVRTADGRPLAVMFGHAAHAVCLGADNTLISADWPGAAQRAVERALPGATALFVQGCCGNINCHPRGSFELAERLGLAIAGAALKAASAGEHRSDVQIHWASRTIHLPLAGPPPVEEAERLVEWAREEKRKNARSDNYGMRKFRDGMIRWAEAVLEYARRGSAPPVPFEIQVVRIGDCCIVGLPGEVFAEYAVDIAAGIPATLCFVAGYTNGNIGYVPTAHAFEEGGYEVDTAYRFYTTLPLTPECERLILEAAWQVAGSLFGE